MKLALIGLLLLGSFLIGVEVENYMTDKPSTGQMACVDGEVLIYLFNDDHEKIGTLKMQDSRCPKIPKVES